MFLAYPEPTTDLVSVVGWDAFLEALGYQSLRVCIFDKVPTTIEEALHIALNLEALDHSQDVDLKMMAKHQECTAEEVKKKKDKYVKVAAQPVPESIIDSAPPTATVLTFADIRQLCDAFVQCTQQMERM